MANTTKVISIIAIVAALIIIPVLIVSGIFYSSYNRLVSLDESIRSSWAQVENVLQRRNDLIPNLVNTVKGYAAHEKEIFEHIADARAQLAGARTLEEKVQANLAMESALARLLAIVERYPDLKANQNFLSLQDELAGTENRIAVERRRYNEAVRAYNITVRKFPTTIVARLMGFAKQDIYFEAAEEAKEVPKVEF